MAIKFRKVRNKHAWKSKCGFFIYHDSLFFKYWIGKDGDYRVKFADSLEAAKQIAETWK